MSSTQYKYILRDAWNITIKNKVLWIWGIFASLISFEGIYETVTSQFVQFRQPEIFYVQLLNTYQTRFIEWADNIRLLNILSGNISAFIVSIFIVALLLIGLWFVMISQIVLISSAANIYRKKKVDLTKLFHQATDKFWQVLGVNLIARLAIYLGFILLSLPLLYSITTSVSPVIFLANIIFFALFVIFSVIIGFLTIYAINFIVIDDVHFGDAIHDAWELFKKNKVLSLEVALMLFIAKVLSVIFVFALGFVVGTPLVAFIMLSIVNGSALGVGIGIVLLVLLISGIILLVNTVFTVFYLSSWTITFIEMTKKNVMSKLYRMVEQLTGKFVKRSKNYIDTVDTAKIEAKLRPYAQKALIQAKKETKSANKVLKEKYVELEPVFKKEVKKMVSQAKVAAKKELAKQTKKAKASAPKVAAQVRKELKKQVKKAQAKTTKQPTRKKATRKRSTTKVTPKRKTRAKSTASSRSKKPTRKKATGRGTR